MISYIVSVLDRMASLNACLASLPGDGEILVCCNSTDEATYKYALFLSHNYGGSCVQTGLKCDNCYDSANLVATMAEGDWLCFPSDDSLYVADFAKIMIETAVRTQADLVYCDMVYKCGSIPHPSWPAYSVLHSEPRMGKIDKTNFIIRRELFKGFPPHDRGYRDGALIEQVVRDGAKHAKAPGILALHQ